MCQPDKVSLCVSHTRLRWATLHVQLHTSYLHSWQTSFAKGQEILPYDPSLTRKYSTLSLLCVSRIWNVMSTCGFSYCLYAIYIKQTHIMYI